MRRQWVDSRGFGPGYRRSALSALIVHFLDLGARSTKGGLSNKTMNHDSLIHCNKVYGCFLYCSKDSNAMLELLDHLLNFGWFFVELEPHFLGASNVWHTVKWWTLHCYDVQKTQSHHTWRSPTSGLNPCAWKQAGERWVGRSTFFVRDLELLGINMFLNNAS